MTRARRILWLLTVVVVLVLGLSALPQPAESLGCGETGSFTFLPQWLTCAGQPTNCEEIKVCAPEP